MEEFEISVSDLDIKTDYINYDSDCYFYSESGVCNYQSPTYNTYQYQNPNYNIFVNPVINNYRSVDYCMYSCDKSFIPEEIFIKQIEKPHKMGFTSHLYQNEETYIVANTNHIDKTVCTKTMTREEVIEMLEHKAEEALFHKYKVKVIL